jgi:two-component system sensor histidine kinase RegB
VRNGELFLELLLDVSALTIQLYLSGGATNPFVSLYLLQVILGAVLLDAWSAWVLVLLTSGCFVWLMTTFRPIAMPHAHGMEMFNVHIQGMFICYLLAAVLLVSFVTRIQRNLRQRDARLADLRQRSLEEGLIVRMGLLASGAAHELGTPLSTLSVILSDWRRVPSISRDQELAAELQEMQVQLDRCKTIVSGILLSAGEARGEGAQRSTFATFFDGLIEEWRRSRAPIALEAVNALHPDRPVVVDETLKRAIFNVLDNALDVSPAWIGIRASRFGDCLLITVTDRGPGFSGEAIERLGMPYQSSKGRPGGGLGLFLVVNVVRKFGGKVNVENRPEGGAEVKIVLPMDALSPENRA